MEGRTKLASKTLPTSPAAQSGAFLGKGHHFRRGRFGARVFNLFGDIVESARSGVAHEGIPIACDLARV